jgi:glutamate synthase (ferredoxin)
MMMVVPEAWEKQHQTSDDKKSYNSACIMEPWDGPASIPFTMVNVMGALLDEMVSSFSIYLTKSGFVMSSEMVF